MMDTEEKEEEIDKQSVKSAFVNTPHGGRRVWLYPVHSPSQSENEEKQSQNRNL